MHFAKDGTALSQRGGFWSPGGISRDVQSGSLWVADTRSGQVVRLSERGDELWRRDGFLNPSAVSANPTDGSCWVADTGHKQAVHVSVTGEELWRGGMFITPADVGADPRDGSCWVADLGTRSLATGGYTNSAVVHLGADGAELWRGTAFEWPALALDPLDGSVWVADFGHGQVVHLAPDGQELFRGGDVPRPYHSVTVNPADHSCWVGYRSVGTREMGGLVHLSAEGAVLWEGGSLVSPECLSADPSDGSCWVADEGAPAAVVHVAADGTVLWRGHSYSQPLSLSVNEADGSCWVADGNSFGAGLTHLAASGTSLLELEGTFMSVSTNPVDGSCWTYGGYGGGLLTRLAADGTTLWSATGVGSRPCVNPTDGSCWVADTSQGQIVHLSVSGAELWRGGSFLIPAAISVDPEDGSVWVADLGTLNVRAHTSSGSAVVHLSAEGTELWRSSAFNAPGSVSVNRSNGTCWVADTWNEQVVLLGRDGVERWRGGSFTTPSAVSADMEGDRCWVADATTGEVVLLSADGAELSSVGGFSDPVSLSANASDRSCWVADAWGAQVAHLVIWFADVPPSHWAFPSVFAAVKAGIVKGYPDGTYQPTAPVTRDQMAVYVSRALVIPSGDAAIPDPTPPPTFSDVASTHWAYKHIEYAVAKNVVKGHDDGTYKPDLVVDRGQMAVFVARAMVTPSGDAGIPDPVPPATFPDVPSGFWAYKQVEYCVGHGVVKGYDDGTYRPGDPVTRDQMAVYVARAFKLPL